jgi:CTP:molybdopterin cytidylyltransferase MocA/HD superfamily phosphohydrolase YqeK
MGEFKPLLSFGDTTILERDVSLFRDAGIEDVRVVIGHRAADLLPLLERLHARPVMNERYADGMFSSVLAGVESLEELVEAFFLLPVDIPLVQRQTIFLLAEAFRKGDGRILYPAFRGKRGHPPLIASCYREEILAWSGDGGLKSFLSLHDGEAMNIETEDEGILLDMDTLAEYDRLRSAWRKNAIPAAEECEILLVRRFAAEAPLLDHCRRVANLSVFLAKRLNEAGCRLDPDLIEAAALLHDLAKGKPNHAPEGARILDEMGYRDIARLVAVHMDIVVDESEPVGAGEVLYLADKMTSRNRCVPVEERFAPRVQSHGLDPEIRGVVDGRLRNALLIRNRIEAVLGRTLHEVLSENGFM